MHVFIGQTTGNEPKVVVSTDRTTIEEVCEEWLFELTGEFTTDLVLNGATHQDRVNQCDMVFYEHGFQRDMQHHIAYDVEEA